MKSPKIHWISLYFALMTLFVLVNSPFSGLAQTPAPAASAPAVASASQTITQQLTGLEEKGMTLYGLLHAGGSVMIVLAGLSILAVTLIIYFLFTLTEKRIVPNDMVTQIRHYVRDGRYDDVVRLCRRSKGMFSKVIQAGLARGATDPSSVSSTMETVGRREAENIMRQIHYLSDIGTISPLVGLLGTVLGMINAFNFIAFDVSTVKPVALATSVAQSLVATAGGLIVAIPCMGFFYFFRGRLQVLIGRVEEVAVEVADRISKIQK